MIRTIIALAIITLLGLLPGNPVVQESRAEEGNGEIVNGFCPSMPYTGDCGLCHEITAAKVAFMGGNYCYFCPDDPPCVGGACAANAQASVTGVTREQGSSRLLSGLAYFLVPVGAVIGVRIRRRKK